MVRRATVAPIESIEVRLRSNHSGNSSAKTAAEQIPHATKLPQHRHESALNESDLVKALSRKVNYESKEIMKQEEGYMEEKVASLPSHLGLARWEPLPDESNRSTLVLRTSGNSEEPDVLGGSHPNSSKAHSENVNETPMNGGDMMSGDEAALQNIRAHVSAYLEPRLVRPLSAASTITTSSNLSLRDATGDSTIQETHPEAVGANWTEQDLLQPGDFFPCDESNYTPSDMSSQGKPGDKDSLDTPPTSVVATPRRHTLMAEPPMTMTNTSHMLERLGGIHGAGPSQGYDPTAAPGQSTGGKVGRGRPVLYSAIGSLESPTTSWKNPPVMANKYEFPSSRFIPPAHQTSQPVISIKLAEPKNVLGIQTTASYSTATNSGAKPQHRSTLSATLDGTLPSLSPNGTTEDTRPSAANTNRATALVADEGDKKPAAKPSIIRSSKEGLPEGRVSKKVTIDVDKHKTPRSSKKKGPVEMFRPSSDAYTPRMGKKQIKYKPAEMRTPVQQMASPLGTLSRPNFKDALRRVAMIIRQHIVKIEGRFENKANDDLFLESMMEEFSEERFVTPRYKCSMVRVPMARPGMVYGLKQIRPKYEIPSEGEIYEFAHQLFKNVQLSSECSIVCLIYMERLMEVAKVPLVARTWRPIFMCGLLLASKVWQDLSSWNIEFASVYPQYSLESINRLELLFLRMVKWDLYISSSLYAKYYFALRSLVEKSDFRQRYNRMVGGVDNVQASEALKIEKRSTMVKEEALLQLSRSM